jgi:hypothetical protein
MKDELGTLNQTLLVARRVTRVKFNIKRSNLPSKLLTLNLRDSKGWTFFGWGLIPLFFIIITLYFLLTVNFKKSSCKRLHYSFKKFALF